MSTQPRNNVDQNPTVRNLRRRGEFQNTSNHRGRIRLYFYTVKKEHYVRLSEIGTPLREANQRVGVLTAENVAYARDDLNRDGLVNFADFLKFVDLFQKANQ